MAIIHCICRLLPARGAAPVSTAIPDHGLTEAVDDLGLTGVSCS